MDNRELRNLLIVVCVLLLLVCAFFFLFTDAWITGGALSVFFCIIGILGIVAGCFVSRVMRYILAIISFVLISNMPDYEPGKSVSAVKMIGGIAIFVSLIGSIVSIFLPVLSSDGRWITLAELRNRSASDSSSHRMQKQMYPSGRVREVRRTCMRCGKVWHSSIQRENQVISFAKDGAWLGLFNLFNDTARAQWTHNTESNFETIHRMRSCPECGSVNYNEQIV